MHLLWITVIIIAVDQLTKLLVVRYMYVGQSIPLIGDWLKFTFTENPGMAFGITFGPRGLVTVLSLVATGLIVLYMWRVRSGYEPYRASLACILGGAVGNIIDRVFYGLIFHGDSLFTGRVVDFIHVNLWRGYVPESIPLIGGSYAALFPIWNVADMAIVLGVVGILLFQQKFQDMLHEEYETAGEPDDSDTVDAALIEPPPSTISIPLHNGLPEPSVRPLSDGAVPSEPEPPRSVSASEEETRKGGDASFQDGYDRT